ncbi:MAG: sugar transferase [Acidimicrobiia bacterium]|nr:sugar transferase [Acidimicrobiia bacterium]
MERAEKGQTSTFSVRNPEFDVADEAVPVDAGVRSLRAWLVSLVDLVLMIAAIVVVTIVSWDVAELWTSSSVRLGLVVSSVVVYVIGSEGLYTRVQARRWPGAIVVVLRAVAVAVAAFSLVSFFFAVSTSSRRWMIVVAISWAVLLSGHHILRLARRGDGARSRVIVAGSPRAALSMRVALRADRRHGYEVVGFVVDRLTDDIPTMVADMALGSVDDLPHLVERHSADQVMFCMGGLDGDRFAAMTHRLNRAGVHVSLTDLGEIAPRRVGMARVHGRPVVFIAPAVRFGWPMIVKRAVDVSVASILLVALAPFLALVALAIRLVDRQSPIFSHTRIGKNGVPFTIHKFQTMVAARDDLVLDLRNDNDGPVFKMSGDPRITRLGSVLRKTSIDELPQLWNVIRGDMSLVGPRPLQPHEVAAAPISFRDRELVMPGMTGHWQVSGRSDTAFDELDELDRWYVDNWSLGHDLKILAKTVPAVLRARGAR